MNESLTDEISAINSIYGPSTLLLSDPSTNIYILHLPQHSTSLRLQFPIDYPANHPSVLGTQSSGRKGEAALIVGVFRDVVKRVFRVGEVCLFDVVEEVNGILEGESMVGDRDEGEDLEDAEKKESEESEKEGEIPPWTISPSLTEQKSIFVARCAPVSSPTQATTYLSHLLSTDKKVRAATHNITAWRIRGDNGVTYQDCDDDGETAAGGRVLHLLQLMDVWNVMVVVTRWYGGQKLGPKRFSVINGVARECLVLGGFVVGKEGKEKEKGRSVR